MPELPEVETIRLGLERYLVEKKILSLDVNLAKIWHGDKEDVVGATFKSVRRFGKVLCLDLDNNFSIVIHVKLTGQLVYSDDSVSKTAKISRKVGVLPGRFTWVIFKLETRNSKSETSNEGYLYYNDIRQFGWLKVMPTLEVEGLKFIKELGPEPPANFSYRQAKDRVGLTCDGFEEILKGRGTKIKVLLMDQTKIAGVGNIYANDALNLAKIDPRRSAKSLSKDEVKKLYSALEWVLFMGFKHGGASENTYVNAIGEDGNHQDHTLVYGRQGKTCKNCGGKIVRIAISGRGTFLCEKCQK